MQLEQTAGASPARWIGSTSRALAIATTVIACGAYSGPFSAGGWSTVEAGEVNVDAIYATPTDVFLVRGARDAPRGELAHWNGKEWQRFEVPPRSAIAAASARDVWVAGGDVVLHWDGARWSKPFTVETGDVRTIWTLGDGQLWFGGTRMRVSWKTDDQPQSAEGRLFARSGRELRAVNVDADVSSVWASSPKDVWITTGAGARHLDGQRWIRSDGVWHKVWGTGPADVWLVGDSLSIAHWNGSGWGPISVRIAANIASVRDGAFFDVHGTTRANAWAVGSHGIVVHRDGVSWSGVRTGTAAELRAVSVGVDDVWVGGEGVLLRKP
jgi:hypothetical protein